MVSSLYCIYKRFFQTRIMLIAVFNNTHTVINVLFLILQMYSMAIGPGRNIDIG